MFLVQHFILYPSSRYPDVIRLDEIGGAPNGIDKSNIKIGKHLHAS